MRMAIAAAVLALAGCAHDERPGGGTAQSVPRSKAVTENAIPREMPPATPPIPAQVSRPPAQAPQRSESTVLCPPGSTAQQDGAPGNTCPGQGQSGAQPARPQAR